MAASVERGPAVSVATCFGAGGGYHCGYCKGSKGLKSHNHSMITKSLTIDDYQLLVDRGWRRCGTNCYKPTMDQTCCPSYTIRCDITEFKPTKSQKKVIKKLNKYLSSNETIENADSDGEDEAEMPCASKVQDTVKKSTPCSTKKVLKNETVSEPKKCIERETKASKGKGPDPNKVPCKKAKLIRLEKREAKLKSKGIEASSSDKIKSQENQVDDFLNNLPSDIVKKLEIKLVRSSRSNPEWDNNLESISHDLYAKYQIAVHGDTEEKCCRSQFLRFLVQTPLQHETRNGVEYGSFHQQYWLNDELIAVGVIDILPKCVSSVYFFYNPVYCKFTIGTYGALREIGFTRSLQKICPEIKYYYMGFYIHSCVKMRYKGNYAPSYLLCPETYEWFPLDSCVKKLDQSQYSRLNDDLDAVDADYFADHMINDIPMMFESRTQNVVLLKNFKRRFPSNVLMSAFFPKLEQMLIQFGKLVGRVGAQRIVNYFDF